MRGLALALALVWLAGLATAQSARRYAGTVKAVDLADGRVVVEELGRKGRPERHEVYVGPETPMVSASRLRPQDMRGPNAYGEVPVSLVDLVVGGFVVVESADEGGRAVALRITIVEIPSSPASRRTP